MITEEQVLNLWNHSGLRTAKVAKQRMVCLSTTGDQGLNFGSFNQQKYFFVERVWFSYNGEAKQLRTIDFSCNLYVRPNEVNTADPDAFICITPPAHLDFGGYQLDVLSIDPYVFARQATYTPGTQGDGCTVRLLIWEIEE